MKPTDEERREVARRLRESRSFVDGLGRCGMTQNALDTFERILECVGYETGNVFDFLADLIEPAPERTCRNEADALNEREGFETYGFVCSECGYNELKKDVDRALCLRLFDLNYCRMCGARVEGGGE